MGSEQIDDLIKTYSSTTTLSNLVSNEREDLICFIAEKDDGRYRVKVKRSAAVEHPSYLVVAEDKIEISRAYRATDKLYQMSKNGTEVFVGADGRLNLLRHDGTCSVISNIKVDHFSFIDPIDSIVAVVDERLIVRIEMDGTSEVLFDERGLGDYDYFVADPVASLDSDLVAFRFWLDSTMPFYRSSLRTFSLRSRSEVTVDLYPSPIYSQPQFGGDGRYFSYIAVVEDHLKIVLHQGTERTILLPDQLDQGDYDYGFGQRTYCFNDEEDSIYCQNYSDGYSTLIRVNLNSLQANELEYGHFEVPAPTSRGIVAIRSGAKTPTNITGLDSSRSSDDKVSSNKTLIYSSYPLVERARLKEPESFSVESTDDMGDEFKISGHIYRAEIEIGLMVLIHGGPIGASKVTWNPKIPLLNQLGISVVTFNQRGSSGYGHSFMLSLSNRYAVADVDDTLAVIRHVAQLTEPTAPIIISGGSAAGVVAIAAAHRLTKVAIANDEREISLNDKVRGLILNYPVVDITNVQNHTHRFEKSLFEYLIGKFPASLDLFEQRSPKNIDMDLPTLIIHGTNDKVVPIESVVEFAEARPNVRLEKMEGYGHGFSDPEGQRRELQLVTAFVQQHIL